IEGSELEDPATIPEDDIYDWTTTPGGKDAELVEVAFEAGEPTALDGEPVEPVELIEALNERAGAHGVGRTDMMEDRMLGLKVRENYEHPAATVLLNAHAGLEALVLTKDELDFKTTVDDEWAQKGYEGLVDAPVVSALEGFIDETQKKVTGTVTIKLEGGQARVVARESEYAVYSESAASFNTETVDGIEQADATGVAKYHGFQGRLANEVAAKVAESKAELAADGGDATATDVTGESTE
ncbi:MAG: argininosuccinate synthase, partial [Haloferacaceae archaeon]